MLKNFPLPPTGKRNILNNVTEEYSRADEMEYYKEAQLSPSVAGLDASPASLDRQICNS